MFAPSDQLNIERCFQRLEKACPEEMQRWSGLGVLPKQRRGRLLCSETEAVSEHFNQPCIVKYNFLDYCSSAQFSGTLPENFFFPATLYFLSRTVCERMLH